MSREQVLTGLILKRVTLFEADELITFFTKEKGKIRAKAVSVKKSKSKLLGGLASLQEIEIRLAGRGNLPKVIGATALGAYQDIWQNTDKQHFFYWLSEVILKALPDEVPDESLYVLVKKILKLLDSHHFTKDSLKVFICYTALRLMDQLGFGVAQPVSLFKEPVFSFEKGGLVERSLDPKGIKVSHVFAKELSLLLGSQSNTLPEKLESQAEMEDILMKNFHYHLEREVHASRFLA